MAAQDELIAPIGFSIKGSIAVSGLSRSRIFELIKKGKIDARKDGGKTVVLADSLRDYLKSLPPAKSHPDPAAE